MFVRDPTRTRVAQIEDYLRADFVPRFNSPGAWAIELPADGEPAALLGEDCGIVVVRDGTTILSGPVDHLERNWGPDGDVLLASGPDDLIVIDDRIAHPQPGTAAPPYGSTAYDVRTGAAETVMRGYVNVNAGPGALAQRQVAGLTVAVDTALGSSITGRGRYQKLIPFLQELALAGGDLGFRVVQSGSSLQFSVYTPTDKTATAIFSRELGNLRSFQYVLRAPRVNYVYAGGGGEGTARTIREGADSDSIIRFRRRIEEFRDRRDTTDVAELDQTIVEELAQGALETELRIAPIDTEALMFMEDYQLGDRVTVVVDDVPLNDVLREVHISLTASGSEIVEPVIGTAGFTGSGVFDQILGALRRTRNHLSNLERR